MPTPTTLALPDALIARTCALAHTDWLAQFAPLVGLAAVGQHIADIDADRAEQLARRNASSDRIRGWALAARAPVAPARASIDPARASIDPARARIDPAALSPFGALAAAVAFVALLGYLASAGQGYDVLHAAAHACLNDQERIVAGDPAHIFDLLARTVAVSS